MESHSDRDEARADTSQHGPRYRITTGGPGEVPPATRPVRRRVEERVRLGVDQNPGRRRHWHADTTRRRRTSSPLAATTSRCEKHAPRAGSACQPASECQCTRRPRLDSPFRNSVPQNPALDGPPVQHPTYRKQRRPGPDLRRQRQPETARPRGAGGRARASRSGARTTRDRSRGRPGTRTLRRGGGRRRGAPVPGSTPRVRLVLRLGPPGSGSSFGSIDGKVTVARTRRASTRAWTRTRKGF